jgi:hypothetical protein
MFACAIASGVTCVVLRNLGAVGEVPQTSEYREPLAGRRCALALQPALVCDPPRPRPRPGPTSTMVTVL